MKDLKAAFSSIVLFLVLRSTLRFKPFVIFLSVTLVFFVAKITEENCHKGVPERTHQISRNIQLISYELATKKIKLYH